MDRYVELTNGLSGCLIKASKCMTFDLLIKYRVSISLVPSLGEQKTFQIDS